MIRWPEIQAVPGSGRLARPEPFGATIAFRRPELLVMVDRAFARRLGVEPAGRAQVSTALGLDPAVPFEAHLTLGDGCENGCAGCYIGAHPSGGTPFSLGQWREVVDRLACMGVYHLALGGGESTSWSLLLELARHVRARGMTPNLTTAGRDLTPAQAKRLSVFERVHLSMDGAGEDYSAVRGVGDYSSGLMALRVLRAYHPRVGVNCVVARTNADSMAPLFALLDRLSVREVELMRFKPAGRAGDLFQKLDLSRRQARGFVRRILKLALRYRIRVRLDCSFTPMVCALGIAPNRLFRLGLAGCVAGSWLMSLGPDGRVSGCSFDHATSIDWTELGSRPISTWAPGFLAQPPAPCDRCNWLSLCRGGCHVVARHVTGDFLAPDPGCPLVFDRITA